jgi:hypothetical protein
MFVTGVEKILHKSYVCAFGEIRLKGSLFELSSIFETYIGHYFSWRVGLNGDGEVIIGLSEEVFGASEGDDEGVGGWGEADGVDWEGDVGVDTDLGYCWEVIGCCWTEGY